MARTIIDKTPFTQNNYTEDIVPSSEPMAGFGARLPFWSYILGIVEHRLESVNGLYIGFDVTDDFVIRTLSMPIRETNNNITKSIINRYQVSGV
ncbi:hypothetical protein [uncultured Jannaschia sp.]|uniref:hypothetical protein n=1 Tax=uncultured Jannaschia sp. TaxID=293347 RepID=UPI0026274BF2|nr:hypothetical protein [uncultured Jannaschia sp.]